MEPPGEGADFFRVSLVLRGRIWQTSTHGVLHAYGTFLPHLGRSGSVLPSGAMRRIRLPLPQPGSGDSRGGFMNQVESREVGVGLAIGLAFLPILFVWALLRKGYSRTTRILSFGWCAILIGISILSSKDQPPAPPKLQSQPQSQSQSQEALKDSSKPVTESAPAGIQSILKDVQEAHFSGFVPASEGKKDLFIDLKFPDVFSSEASFNMLSQKIYRLAQSLSSQNMLTGISSVNFIVWADMKDRYGKTSKDKIIELSFLTHDLYKIEWNNFTNYDLLNLCKPLPLHPEGRRIVIEFCQDATNASLAPDFTQRVQAVS